MNERIQELARQAEDWADSQNFYASDYRDYLMEKFAELIVRECSRMADRWVDNDDNGKNYPSEMIKKHFGVES